MSLAVRLNPTLELMTKRIDPGRAVFLFTVGTGLASGLGNWLSSNLADKYEGLTNKQLIAGMGVTLAGIVVAYFVMRKMLQSEES